MFSSLFAYTPLSFAYLLNLIQIEKEQILRKSYVNLTYKVYHDFISCFKYITLCSKPNECIPWWAVLFNSRPIQHNFYVLGSNYIDTAFMHVRLFSSLGSVCFSCFSYYTDFLAARPISSIRQPTSRSLYTCEANIYGLTIVMAIVIQ